MKHLKLLVFLFTISNLLYFLSSPSLENTTSVYLTFGISALQSIILVLIFFNSKDLKLLPKYLVLAAIISRIIVIPSHPILEDDYFRYLWDGHVIKNGINPYIHAPSSEKLDHIHTDYRENIGYINVPTIYPPLAEYIFALNSYIGFGKLAGLKVIFVIFDLLSAFVLFKWIRLRSLPVHLNLLYLFNPLVIKEVANSAHLDSILAFFFTLALYLLDLYNKQESPPHKKKPYHIIASSTLALATLIKLSPVFAAPVFLKFCKSKLSIVVTFIFTIVIFSSPFLFSEKFMPGLTSFAKHWIMNESLFYPISYLTTKIIFWTRLDNFRVIQTQLLNETPGKLVAALILFCIIIKYYFKKNISLPNYALLIIVSLLLLSPVFNPWYALWFLPIAIISRHYPTILLSLLLPLSYSYYLNETSYYNLRFIEYLIFFGFLSYWHFGKKVISKKS